MPAPSVERRLAAILAADVAGYARLIEQDEFTCPVSTMKVTIASKVHDERSVAGCWPFGFPSPPVRAAGPCRGSRRPGHRR